MFLSITCSQTHSHAALMSELFQRLSYRTNLSSGLIPFYLQKPITTGILPEAAKDHPLADIQNRIDKRHIYSEGTPLLCLFLFSIPFSADKFDLLFGLKTNGKRLMEN